jgi:predicted nucleic acid-binding protein
MQLPRAVMDTNMLYSGLRSRHGASYELLRLLRATRWTLILSNTVVTEYEEVLYRESENLIIPVGEIGPFLDGLCILAERHQVSGQWQPMLPDPDDEAFACLAFQAKAEYVVTHNLRHFKEVERLKIQVVTPKDFLNIVQQSQ